MDRLPDNTWRDLVRNALLLTSGLAGVEVVVHYVLGSIDPNLPLLQSSLLRGVVLFLVAGPITYWFFRIQGVQQRVFDVRTAGYESPHRKIGVALMLSATVIMMALVAARYVRAYSNNGQVAQSHIMNLAGRQRALSQMLCNASAGMVLLDGEDRVRARRSLEATLERIEKESQHLATYISQALQGRSGESEQAVIRAIATVQPYRRRLMMAAGALQGLDAHSPDALDPLNRQVFARAEEFLPRMESAVGSLQSYFEHRLRKTMDIGNALDAILLVTVLTIALIVVFPVVALVRRQHEAASARADEMEHLALVAQRTRSAVVMAGPDLLVTWVNPGYSRITRRSPEEVVGCSALTAFEFDKGKPETLRDIQGAFSIAAALRCEAPVRDKDGNVYRLDIDIQPVFEEQEKLQGFVIIASDMTEIVDERERCESVIAAMPAGLVQANDDGMISLCNPAAAEILGMSIQDLTGKFISDDCWNVVRENGERLAVAEYPASITLETGKSVRDAVYGVYTPANQLRWIAISSEPILNPDGSVRAAVVCFVDVTESLAVANELRAATDLARNSQRAAEQAREAVELQRIELKQIIDAIPAFIYYKNDDNVILNLNQHAAEMIGRPAHEICGRRLDELLDGELNSTFLRDDSDVLTSGRPRLGFVEQFATSGEGTRYLRTDKIPLRGSLGGYDRVVSVSTDITEQKEAVDELDRLASRLAIANEGAGLGIWDLDLLTGEMIWDATMNRLYEIDPEDSTSSRETWFDAVHPEDRANVMALFEQAINGTRRFRTTYRILLADGEVKHLDVAATITRNDEERPVRMVGVNWDVTERVRYAEMLTRAQEAAEAASRSKSEFLANMSHEIRTPMTAILGYTDILSAECGDDPASTELRNECIRTVRRNGEHLLAIINDILDISKIEAGKMSVEVIDVAPAQLLAEVLSLMRVKAVAKNLMLDLVFETPIPEFMKSDPIRMRQILMNIVGNAIKFTESGGVTMYVSCDKDRQVLQVDVVDTGIGISDEGMHRLFAAFEQADTSMTRRFGGTGLGLRISKRLAEMLGGDLELVASTLNVGSRFRVTLGCGSLADIDMVHSPLSVVMGDAMQESSNQQSDKPLSGIRLLLAEDGPDNQRLISHFLKREGAVVEICGNGKLALECALQAWEAEDSFDVILMDMQMPVMDGYQATKALRRMGYRLPILALTAHAMEGERKKCLDTGCDGFATKPINRDALVSSILAVLNSRGSSLPV